MYRRKFSMKNAFNMVGFVLTICVLCGFFFDSWTALLIFIDISLFFFSSFAVCMFDKWNKFWKLVFLVEMDVSTRVTDMTAWSDSLYGLENIRFYSVLGDNMSEMYSEVSLGGDFLKRFWWLLGFFFKIWWLLVQKL